MGKPPSANDTVQKTPSLNASPQDHHAEMQKLANNPTEALRRWAKLSDTERLEVEGMVRRRFGDDFFQLFREKVRHDPRPDLTVVMINDKSLTPEALQKQGYSKRRDDGNVQIWVHPSGRQVWLMSKPSGSAVTPPTASTAKPSITPREHPDIEDARDWVSHFTTRMQDIRNTWSRLKPLVNPDGSYPNTQDFMDYINAVSKLQDDLKEVLDDEAPLWGAGMTQDEQAKLNEKMDDLKALQDEAAASDNMSR